MSTTPPQLPSFGQQWNQRIRALKDIPPVLKIVWNSGRGVVSAGLALRVATSLLPIAMLAISRLIIDGVTNVSHGKALPPMFWYWVAAEFVLAALGGILSRAIGFCDSLLADRFSRYLSVRVMAHASHLDLMSYENPVFYDKLERARVQATDRIGMIVASGTLIQQVIMAIGFCASLLWFSPWVLAILVLCILPAFIGESHFAFLGYSLNFRQTPMRRQLDYLRVLGASKESAKELKLFGLSRHFSGIFENLSDILYEQNVALAKRRLFAGGGLSLLTSAGYYGCYAWVIWRAVQGEFSVGTLTFMAGAISGASNSIQSIFSTFSSIADQALFLTDLIQFFGVKPAIAAKENAIPAPRSIREGFRFENVSFRYPGTKRVILDNLNMQIEPGERIALVGENGQGKTTMVKLLARLYDPTEGRITLDGIDLRDYEPESLAREIGVIFQDFMRYDMPARDNIAVGRIELIRDPNLESYIHDAAQKSLAQRVIDKMPNGYDQMLGRRFEGGVDLSGGEWQKIALARAYLRDAQLLILDEPTAALDARSEFEVFERFADLTRGKMALLISHRFSTVRMADRILVLEGGRVVEEGVHDRLIALGGRYASMFELQAASYR